MVFVEMLVGKGAATAGMGMVKVLDLETCRFPREPYLPSRTKGAWFVIGSWQPHHFVE